MFWPCETRTSTCRNFATISSGLYRFLAITVLLDVKDIPQVGPLQWGWIMKTEQVKRLKDLELENSRLRKAVSDLTLDKLILQEAARGNFQAPRVAAPALSRSAACFR